MYYIGMIYQECKNQFRHCKFSVCVIMQGRHRVS